MLKALSLTQTVSLFERSKGRHCQCKKGKQRGLPRPRFTSIAAEIDLGTDRVERGDDAV